MRSKKYLSGFALIMTFAVPVWAQNTTSTEVPVSNEYSVGAVLFVQKAAEYRALAYQAFNIARWMLDADLDKANVKRLPKAERNRPRAIVVDVDETVIDNSPMQVQRIKAQVPYSQNERRLWQEKHRSRAVPGAVDFITYAVSKGVKVFYVSNRDVSQLQATIDTLKSAAFPDITPDNVLLRGSESSKEGRRNLVSKTHRIVLLMGDNLDDFSNVFERKSITDRFAETDKLKDEWGKRFIVLPNMMYGTWENAIYDYARLTEAQKAQKRADALELP